MSGHTGSPGTPIRPNTPRHSSSDDRHQQQQQAPSQSSQSQAPLHRRGPAVLVAHKKGTVLGGPSRLGGSGSSWKRSWGVEPPGWSSRSTHLPVEISVLTSDVPTGIRDVFSGAKHGDHWVDDDDDDAWEDEEDDHIFAGGVGQVPASSKRGFIQQKAQHPISPVSYKYGNGKREIPPPLFSSVTKVPETGKRPRERNNRNMSISTGLSPGLSTTRQRGGGSPIAPVMSLPETVSGPQGGGNQRSISGRHALRPVDDIQEEEEGEEADEDE